MPTTTQHSRPNILVLLTDDHGQWASGCYGNRELHTPSMDYLARSGARMPNAFTTSPVCSPARASFWTGRIPSSHGVHDHIADPDLPGITGQPTLAQHLQAAGYRTGLCGKWHAHAHGAEHQPGFDRWFSQWGGTNARFGPQPFSRNGRRIDLHGQQAPLITDAAREFLHAAAATPDQPFFLFVGYTDTHSPFASLPERLVSHCRQASFDAIPDDPLSPVHGAARNPFSRRKPHFRESLAQYYAAVEMIDEQVGSLLDCLEGLGQLDRTLVVYTSDHGHMNGHHGLISKGNATTPQNLLDTSIRIPCLLRWPNRIHAGIAPSMPVDHCDLHATLREAAGLAPTADALPAPGRAYLSALADGTVPDDWRDWQISEYGNARMIRSMDGLKLIRRYPGPNGRFPDALFDLRCDPRETRNVIDDPRHQAEIIRLDALLASWFERFELPAASGLQVGNMPPFNANEPWRRSAKVTG